MFLSVRVAPLILLQNGVVGQCLVFGFDLRVVVRIFGACRVVRFLRVRLLVFVFGSSGRGGMRDCG